MLFKIVILISLAFQSEISSVISTHPKCASLVADLVIILNIGEQIISNRTFIHSIIGQFPIGADLRVSLVSMSAECRTLIKLQDGISHDAVLQASNKPYFPGWGADYVSCFEKVGKMENREYSNRIMVILALVNEPPSNPNEQVKNIVKELDDQEDVHIFVVATSKNAKRANFVDQMFFDLGGKTHEDHGKIASKIAAKVCDSVCSARKSRANQCGWDSGKKLCVEKMKWQVTNLVGSTTHHLETELASGCNTDTNEGTFFGEPLNKSHPACEKFKSVEKERPCPLKVCQDLCNDFQWGPWDECCGDTINETYAIRRRRNVSEYARHPDFCSEEEVALCVVNGPCWKTVDMIVKRGEVRFMAYVICLIFVIILAFIGATILCTSRRRSREKLERRLRAAGLCSSLKDLARDEIVREAMKKMPLLASYVAEEDGEKESTSDDSS